MTLREDFHRYGLVRAIRAKLWRAAQRYFGLHVWVIQSRPLVENFKMPADHAARFEFKRLSLEDALTACEDESLGMDPEFVRDAFARGDICQGTFENGKLVTYCWRTTDRAPVAEGLWLRIHGQGIRYGHKSFVLPAYRGIRLSHSNARFYDHPFISNGIRTDIGYVDLHNLASLRNTYRDPDRKTIGYAGYLSLADRYRTWRSRKVRQYLSFEERAEPTRG